MEDKIIKIIQGRGTGKTTNLIVLAKENDGVIVTSKTSYVVDKMYRLGITGISVISYRSFLDPENQDFAGRKIFIDELEAFVNFVIKEKGSLAGYTLGLED